MDYSCYTHLEEDVADKIEAFGETFDEMNANTTSDIQYFNATTLTGMPHTILVTCMRFSLPLKPI